MLQALVLLSALGVQAPAPGAGASQTPEQLATGAVAEIMSAQAVHKKNYPDVGYACGLERLVEAQLLLDVWLAGKRVDGYTFKVWCDATSRPQATYRATAVPVKKAEGARLTVCTDESNVPRTIEGDVAACFAKGQPAR
jgi:hypothetical protein